MFMMVTCVRSFHQGTCFPSISAVCRERQQQQQQVAAKSGMCYGDVDSLQHHWDKLDAQRKVSYAQMAALTRCDYCAEDCDSSGCENV